MAFFLVLKLLVSFTFTFIMNSPETYSILSCVKTDAGEDDSKGSEQQQSFNITHETDLVVVGAKLHMNHPSLSKGATSYRY